MKSSDNDEQMIWTRVETALQRPARPSPALVDAIMAEVNTTVMEAPPERHATSSMARWLTRRRTFTVSPLQLMAATLVLAVALGLLGSKFRDRSSTPVSSESSVLSRTPIRE